MFNNVALDVFIGLIFIFLLYSLLATILMEFIAHFMSLRARLLLKALRRMLEDNPPEIFGIKQRLTFIDFFSDVKEFFKRYFMPFKNLNFLKRFYYHPTVKYLGESRSSSKPSYLQATNFSQTITQLFRGENQTAAISQIAAIESFLFKEAEEILKNYERHEHWIINDSLLEKYLAQKNITFSLLIEKLQKFRNNPFRYQTRKLRLDQLITKINELGSLDAVKEHRASLTPVLIQVKKKVSRETLTHFQNLFIDAQSDLDKFKQQLEIWFNETMERVSGWYKRQTQLILLCLGFGIAIWANVDTIKIYKTLAKDKRVRDQLVNMAIQSQDKYSAGVDSIRQHSKKDSIVTSASGDTTHIIQTKVLTTGDSVLDRTYKLLEEDITSAGDILGLGWCSSDSCKKYRKLEAERDSLKRVQSFLKKNNGDDSTIQKLEGIIDTLSQNIKTGYKKFKDPYNGWSIVGWLITALAISLGAPFWFDLLSKLVKLRSSGAKANGADTKNKNGTTQNNTPLTVNVNTNAGEEAVG